MFIDGIAVAAGGPAQAQGADVLVIDDEQFMCEGCRQTLEAEGYRAAVAPDGRRGLEIVQRVRPKVVLVDLKMPGMTGTEVIARISEIDPSIVSIVITGYGSVESAVDSMKLGASDFLTKPFEPDRLIESVRRGVELNETRRAAPPVPAEVPAPAAAPEAEAPDKPAVLLSGLETLGQYYALGLDRSDFLAEMKRLEAEARYHAETLGQIKRKERRVLDLVHDLRLVDEVIAKHEYHKDALLQILLDVQEELNWLPRHALRWTARRLNVPLAAIYTIASFYEALSLEPRGEHLVEVCLGTACHVRGAPELLTRVSSVLGIQAGQTDPQQLFTLRTVHCMGCCALAPAMKVDGQYFSDPSVKQLQAMADAYRPEREPACQG